MRRKLRGVVLSVAMLAVVVAPGPVRAVPAPFSSFTFTSNLYPMGFSARPNPASGVFNSDLAFWGNHAYQGTYDGFRIIDVTDKLSPTTVIDYTGCSGTSASNQGDVIVWDTGSRRLLVRSWNSVNTSLTRTCDGDVVPAGFEGLHVFDITNPVDPDLVATVGLPCGSHTATGVPDAANGRLLVYNSASSATCPWIDIVEVPFASPQSARLIGVAPSGRSCHDTGVILGSVLRAACAGGNGFTVFSIGGPSGGSLGSPRMLYSVTVPGVSIGHSAAFSWDGDILVFGHEPGGGGAARCQATSAQVDKTLFFFDTATGTEVGRWVLPRDQTNTENCTVHNFNIVPTGGGTNVLASGNYQAGIAVVDFTNPAAATEIAYADPAPLNPTQLVLGGDWSSYYYNGHIYESDITRGLLIWRLRERRIVAPPAAFKTLDHLNPQTQEFSL